MLITHKLNLDLQIRNTPPRLTMVQSDLYSRAIEISLFSGGQPWIPETLETALLRYRKSDGTGGCYDTMPDGTTAWNWEENRVTILLVPQLLAIPGLVEAQVALISGECLIASFTFQITVEGDLSLNFAESTDYINWTAWAKAELDHHLQLAKESGDFIGATFLPDVDAAGNLIWANNQGLENPEPVNIVDLVCSKLDNTTFQGIMASDLNMNGYRITELPEPAADNEPTTKQYVDLQRAEVCLYAESLTGSTLAPNLLDNSNFTKPINQRGITTKTMSTQGYTIDRWRMAASGTVTVNSGYLSIRGAQLTQLIESHKIDPEKTYTAMLWLNDGTVIAETGSFTANTTGNYFAFTLTEGNVPCLGINSDADIVYAALYKGSYPSHALPHYQPKGYLTELAECCRYYFQCSASQSWGNFLPGVVYSATEVRLTLNLPEQMRVNPTVILEDVSKVDIYTNGATTTTKSLISSNTLNNSRSLILRFTPNASLTANHPVVGRINTLITISADL